MERSIGVRSPEKKALSYWLWWIKPYSPPDVTVLGKTAWDIVLFLLNEWIVKKFSWRFYNVMCDTRLTCLSNPQLTQPLTLFQLSIINFFSDDRLFSQYHSKLSDCLSDLVNAIHKVMKSKWSQIIQKCLLFWDCIRFKTDVSVASQFKIVSFNKSKRVRTKNMFFVILNSISFSTWLTFFQQLIRIFFIL